MPRWSWPREAAQDIARARQIAEVLIRNGLGFMVDRSGLARYLPLWRAQGIRKETPQHGGQLPERIRRTLEELGPTYVKLGQILSTRPDVLPEEYIVELSKLQDDTPAAPPAEIIQVIERELGQPIDRLYATFTEEPIASASIGQVHRATLPDGRAVVIKVQRPGIEKEVEADLRLIRAQAKALERRSKLVASLGLSEVIQEFSDSLLNELDYHMEGRNADRLRELVRDDLVLLPEIIWDHTTRGVLTMTDLEGIKISERSTLIAAGYDLQQVAERVIDAYMSQVFVHGIFHADPHPGNIMVCGDRIGLVDLGNVGYLTPAMRDRLGQLLFSLVRQDADELLQVLVDMGAMSHQTDTDALRREIQRLLLRYYGVSLESIPIAQFLSELMGVAFHYHIRLPGDLALLARTVVVLEGVIRSLEPSVVLAKRLEPFIIRLLRERVSPKRLGLDAVKTIDDLRAALQVLPRRMDLLSDQLARGEMTVGVDLRRMDQMLRRAEAIGNRISFSVVIAAIIMGSALILLGGEEAAAFRLPLTDIVLPIPQVAFLAAGLLGAWWLISIVRSKGL